MCVGYILIVVQFFMICIIIIIGLLSHKSRFPTFVRSCSALRISKKLVK